jgi:fatty acid desaturase
MAEKKKAETKKAKKRRHEVTFYTYPKFIFCWPLIAMGFLLWPFAHYEIGPETLAWIYGVTVVLVVVTMGLDVNRNYAAFWIAVIVGLWMMILWLGGKGVTLFVDIHHFFQNLDPHYSANVGLIISIPLLIFYGIMWLWTRINCRWRITHNEFEHYQFGRMDDSLARGAKRIRSSYPDLFELLVCLAGDLIIYDATGKRVIRRISNVPLLPIVKRRINTILEATAVTTSDIIEDEAGAAVEEGVEIEDEDTGEVEEENNL